MAILQGSSLTNCLYIPDFIPSGTVMVFESTSAPTSWTKSSTHNDKSLRIVNGPVTTTSASSSFSTVLSASRTLTTPATDGRQTGYQFAPGPANISTQSSTPPITLGNALATPGPHTHGYQYNPDVNRTNAPTPTASRAVRASAAGTAAAGGGGVQHTHSLTAVAHSHTVSGQDHLHTITESPHAHGVTFDAQPFAVYYRDVILATKD
jgi:hypothetical protein